MATTPPAETLTVSPLIVADEPSSTRPMVDRQESTQLVKGDDGKTKPQVGIRYTAECRDREAGRRVRISQDDEPLEIHVSDSLETSTTTPAIELITELDVWPKQRDSEEILEPKQDRFAAKQLSDYRIDNVRESILIIHSAYLKKLLRKVVEYYPSQNLVGETILIKEPFAVLAHHADELASMLSPNDQGGVTSYATNTEENHLRVLLNFIRSHVKHMYLPAKNRLQHATAPTVTFNDAWYMLKPGLKAYADINGVCFGCIIESVQLEERDVKKGIPRRWAVVVWFMNVDWRQNEVNPVLTTVYVDTFGGEREVTSLSVYPRDYHDSGDDGARRRHLEERGQKMREIIWNGHQILYYDGELATKPLSRLTDQVIVGAVDVRGVEFPDASEWVFQTIKTQSKPPSIPETDFREPLQYTLHPKKHGREYLTRELLFMMCPVHVAFVLSTKTWTFVNVDNTKETRDVEIPPEPILDQSSRDTIDALAGYQLTEEKPWSADFIRDKGEGVVIMLHGPPGVGKTYTVESLALRMRRPLVTLSIAEIGIKEEQIQAELKKWLTLAELWQAILLIDECDVFLERREAFDIARNGVVAAFLRNIEYFSGLLFLTTNRVGHIDEAFLSRVHATIPFHPLGEASRKVLWKSLLDKVHRDRPDKIQIHTEAIMYLESKEMLQIEWNGREIRNAMQTAIALAEKDAKKSPYYQEGNVVFVLKSHFEAVQRLNKSFKDYLTSIREEDPIERARIYSRRNDAFPRT